MAVSNTKKGLRRSDSRMTETMKKLKKKNIKDEDVSLNDTLNCIKISSHEFRYK